MPRTYCARVDKNCLTYRIRRICPICLSQAQLAVRPTRNQVNAFAAGNLDAPDNSVVLERQSQLALLEVKLVRAVQCSRAQQCRGAQPGLTPILCHDHCRVRDA